MGAAERCAGGRLIGGLGRIALFGGAQDNAVILYLGIDAAVDLPLGNPVEHGGIGRRRFGPEIAVIRCEVAKVFCNGLHRAERLVKAFQRTREGSVRYG